MIGLVENVEKWAIDRNLVEGSDPKSQFLKLVEEVGELGKAINRNNSEQIVDGIGDAVVVLTILAMQHNISIHTCLNFAWEEIKDRKGKMINNVFVKEADL